MTSPHAADQEVIASIATTVLDDSPSNNLYTAAADNTATEVSIAVKNSANVRIMENNSNSPSPNGLTSMEQLQIATTATPPPITNATTEIPRTPPAQIKKEITVHEPAIPETPDMEDDADEYSHMTMAQQQQLDNMMAYQGAPGSHDLTMDAAAMANMSSNAMGYGDEMMMAHYDHRPQYQQPPDETRISAYALLEFEDGQFYMNTYQVILGRDLAAAKAAMRRDAELERIKVEEEAGEGVPQTSVRVKNEGTKGRHARSVISESAGILREGSDSDSDSRARRKKKASKKTKSSGSMSEKVSRRPSLVQPVEKINYQPQQPTRRKGPETQGAVPVDPSVLRPSPHDCPLVGIHPPASTAASGYKAISRQHVKIFYNAKKSLFEVEIIGRNGAFVDDVFYYYQDIIPLKSGSYLQIGGVVVRFVLPDVAIGETGAEMPVEQEGAAPERYREGDKEMSFEFETPRDAALLGDSSDEESNEADIPQPGIEHDDDDDFENVQQQTEENPVTPQNNFDDDDDEISSLSDVQDEDDENDVREETQAVQDERPSQPVRRLTLEEQQHQQQQQLLKQHQQNQKNQQQYQQTQQQHQSQEQQQQRTGLPDFQFPMPQKKRGPGRPPKNGIMSKREQQLAKKEAQQRAMMEEQMANGHPGMQMGTGIGMDMVQSISGKNKVGRPRKNPLDESPVKTEKRKYTKRKPKDPEAPGFPQHGSGDEGYNKQCKEKKSTKPPRSPSPTFNEADLTPEQLAKPQANYVTLIHEALSNSPTGQMSLPQIYRAIQRRYPFFVLKCNTNGWQSSVRHNLSQHHAFRKVERDGKGWMWAIVDGVSIEKEKKRRPTPPLHQLPPHLQHQPIYRAGPPPPGYMPQGMMPPPGYMMPQHMRPGQPPYMGQPMYAMPPGPPPPQMNGHPPPGYPPVMSMAQPLAPATGTYSSPYAPKPPQGPPPPQQQPQAPMMQHHGPPPSQQNLYQQQPPRPIQQAHPVNHDAKRQQAIDNFRVALVNNMKAKTSKADAIVASAINRATGVSSQSNISSSHAEHKMEDQIITALKQLLAKFPPAQQQPQYPSQGGPPPPMQQQMQPPLHQGQARYPPPQPQHMQQQVQQPLQHNVPPQGYQQPPQAPPQQSNEAPRQPLATISPQAATPQQTQAEAPKPPVQRPSFSGQSQNRPAGPSVPRPPMVTPGMSRTASGSGSANQTRHGSMSASPANGIATPVMNSVLQGAVHAGQQTGTPTSSAVPASLQRTTPNGVIQNTSGSATQFLETGGQQQSLPQQPVQPAPQQPLAVPQQAPLQASVQQAPVQAQQAPAPQTQPQLCVETQSTPQQLPQTMQPLQAPVPEPLTPMDGRSPSASVVPQPQPVHEQNQQQAAPSGVDKIELAATPSSAEKNENGKRLPDADLRGGNGEPEFKRIDTSGPKALKA